MTNFKNGKRIVRKNTPSRQKHVKNYDRITELWKEGKTRSFICKEFKLQSSTLHYILKRLGLENPPPKSVNLSKYEKSVLIGTIMGDSHILSGSPITSSLNFAHCNAQKEYFDVKVDILKKLNFGYNKEHNYYDKRTNKIYKRYTCTSHSFVELKTLRHIFYKNGKKILPIEFLRDNFNEISLAYLYMDDGSTQKYNTIISMQCYERKELEDFVIILKSKFDLEFTVQFNNTLRIKQKDVKKFKELVRPEVEKITCMTYKL